MKKFFWPFVIGIIVSLSALDGGAENVVALCVGVGAMVASATLGGVVSAVRKSRMAWRCASSAVAEALQGVHSELHARNRYS
jgi:hypothetical protein